MSCMKKVLQVVVVHIIFNSRRREQSREALSTVLQLGQIIVREQVVSTGLEN